MPQASVKNYSQGFFQMIFKLLLLPFSLIYLIMHILDKALKTMFRTKMIRDIRVISIGNITTGGTGKTPMTIYLANKLKIEHPVILTRGYGASVLRALISYSADLKPGLFGDEPLIIAKETGCPVAIDPVRSRGLWAARNLSRTFIMDDGFQHYSLERSADIVLIDAMDPFGEGLLLPAGRLREPVAALKRADIIVITHAEHVSAGSLQQTMKALLKYGPGSERIFKAETKTEGIFDSAGRPFKPRSGGRIFAFAGIGNFKAFKETVRNLFKDRTTLFKQYPDHWEYGPDDIQMLKTRQAEGWDLVTTQKDSIKLDTELPALGTLKISMKIKGKKEEQEFLKTLEKY
jgi:tetraacyldisaccharide 4'-kinase